MKLGVFTVMLPDLSPDEVAAALKTYGYDGVEWRVSDPRLTAIRSAFLLGT
ncbi:MAG: hypothetical protein R2880_21225 [Deinococcales bacterium]